MSQGGSGQPFWSTLPGILTGVGGIVAGLGALVTALAAAGILGGGDSNKTATPAPSAVSAQAVLPGVAQGVDAQKAADIQKAAAAQATVSAGGAAAVTGAAYPKVVVDDFMAGCLGAGAPFSSCNCAMKNIEAHVTIDEYLAAYQALAYGFPVDQKVAAALTRATIDCAGS